MSETIEFRFIDTKIPQSSDIHTKNPPGISAGRVQLKNGTNPWVVYSPAVQVTSASITPDFSPVEELT